MAFMTSKYKLTVTEKQAEIMRDALELYARIHAGQISTLSEHLPHILSGKADLTEELKKAYKPFSAHKDAHGYHPTNNSEISWDLYTLIRHRLAWDKNPKGGIFVSFDSPTQHGSEPTAIIEKNVN